MTHRLSCSAAGMWDLPGPGLEPVSPALAGGFLTTAPPGKPSLAAFNILSLYLIFDSLINVCLAVFHLVFILYGTLYTSWS